MTFHSLVIPLRLTEICSPGFTSRLALIRTPPTKTLPSRMAAVAKDRVLNTRTLQRNLSTLTTQSSTINPTAGIAEPVPKGMNRAWYREGSMGLGIGAPVAGSRTTSKASGASGT